MTRPVDVEALLAHRAWVRALSRAIVADPGRADDVEQAAWLTALRRPPSSASNLKAWLARVVRSRALDAARETKRRDGREELAARRGAFASAADVAARFDTERRVARAVAELTEPLRTTVLLRFYEELSVREVARRMEVPYETARARLNSAIARLRRALAGDDERGLSGVALLGLATEGVLMTAKNKAALALLLLVLGGAGIGVAVTGLPGRSRDADDAPAAATDPAAAPPANASKSHAGAVPGRRRSDETAVVRSGGTPGAEPPAPSLAIGPSTAPPAPAPSTGFTLPERLKGTAVDAETGLPLDGVRILLFMIRPDGRTAHGQGDTTGPDGVFRPLRPTGWDETGAHAELRIAKEGYETARLTVVEAEPVVRLRRETHPPLPGRVVGVARDADGRPLSGVVLVAGEDEIRNNAAQYAVADTGGAFVLEGVPPGYWRFNMLGGAIAEAVVPEGGEARIELVAAADPRTDEERIHGTDPVREGYGKAPLVRDADGKRPAPREVVVTGLPEAPGTVVRASIAALVPRLFWRAEVRSGEARFPSLSAGKWTLTIVEPGRPAVTMPLGVEPGDGPLRVAFAAK